MGRKKKGFLNTGTFSNANPSSSTNIFDDMEQSAFASGSDEDEILSKLATSGFKKTLQEHNGQIQRGNFLLTLTGLEYKGEDLSLDEWKEIGGWLNQLKDSIQWMIGDWANMGQEHLDMWVAPDGREFKTRYAELLEKTDYSYSSLRKFSYVASAFPVFRRRNTLTYSHHAEVAHLPEEEQDRFLDLVEKKDGIRDQRLPVRVLRELVQKEYPPQVKATNDVPVISNNDKVLLTRGLELVMRTPQLSKKNKSDALKAAQFYREIAEKLEQYAAQESSK